MMVEIGQRTALASDVDLIGRPSMQDEAVGRVQFDDIGQQRFPLQEIARRPGSSSSCRSRMPSMHRHSADSLGRRTATCPVSEQP